MTTTLSAASRKATALKQSYLMFVDGKFTEGGGELLSTINPATQNTLAKVSTASLADVDAAVRAARRAYDKVWSRMTGTQRAKYLFRIARLVREQAHELAVLESLDGGIPIRQARDVSAAAAATYFFHYAGWADKLGYAGYGPDPQPLGAAGQVLSSEAPLRSAAARIAPALACGNTVVIKPAGTTPLTALALAKICQQADLPPGVMNVIPGMSDIGAALVAHKDLATVAFTGSTEVARQVQRGLVGTSRRLTLSLTGPADTIVFDDAKLDRAVEDIVLAFVGSMSGSAWSRVLVHEPIAEQLLAALQARAATLRIGDPLDESTDIGAINSDSRLARLRELTSSANVEGARCWVSPSSLPHRGFFVAPTIFSQVSPAMRIAREEVNGPVLPVLTFRTPQEAVALANNSRYGQFAAIWGEQSARVQWAAQRVRAKVVRINTVHRIDSAMLCNGYREPDLSRGAGRVGLEAYLDVS